MNKVNDYKFNITSYEEQPTYVDYVSNLNDEKKLEILPPDAYQSGIKHQQIADELAQSRGDASLADKYFGLSSVFDGTSFGHVLDYFKYNRGFMRPTDEHFVETFDKKKEDQIINAFHLDDSSRNVLREAKNQEMLLDLAEQEMRRKQSQEDAYRIYSSTESLVANLAVGIGTDPTVLLSGGAVAAVKAIKAGANVERVAHEISTLTSINAITKAKTATETAQAVKAGEVTLQDINNLESGVRIAEGMKQTIAKSTVLADITYGAVVGATDDDTSMLEGLLIYGLLSPLDYKIINDVKILDRLPKVTALSRSEVNAMAMQDARLSPLTNDFINHPNAKLKDYKFKAMNDIDKNKGLTNIEKADLKASVSTEISAKLNKDFQAFENTVKQTERDIKALVKANKSITSSLLKKTEELKNSKMHFEDLKLLAKDINTYLNDLSSTFKTINTDTKEGKLFTEDAVKFYRQLHNYGYLSKPALSKIEKAYKNGTKIEHPKIEVTTSLDKDGKVMTDIKINGKKSKIAAGVALVAATSLGASDYSSSDTSMPDFGSIIGMAILGGLLGVPLYKAYKSGSMKQLMRNVASVTKKAKVLEDTRPIRSQIGEVANKSRTTLTETIKPMLDNTKGDVHELAKVLYYNPLDASKTTIETSKRILFSTYSQGFEKEIRPHFNEWLKSKDISKIANVASMFTDMSLRAKYNNEIWHYMTKGGNADKSVIDGAKKVQEYIQQVKKDMIDAGVKNADKMFTVTDDFMYLPRVHKGQIFANKIVGISSASKKALIQHFASILDKTPESRRLTVAETYLENLIQGSNKSAKTFSKNSRESLTKELEAKGLEKDEIDEIISTISGTFGRTKERLHMDYSKFGKFEAEINGELVPIRIDDIFETDVSNILNTYFNQTSGHISLASHGFKSVDDVVSIIEGASKAGEIPPNYKSTILNDTHAMVGIPNIDYSQTMNIVAKNLGNIAVGKMMTLSTLTLASESFVYLQNVISKSGLFGSMKELAQAVRGFGDDSFVASDIPFGKDGLGLAQSRYSASYGQFKTFDEFSNQNSGINKLSKFSEIWRDFTLHTLPFTRTSDFIAKANLQDVLDRLYHHLDGSKPLKAYELSAFPISPKMEKYLKANLKLNKSGHVKVFDYTKEPFATKEEFKSLINNMMMKRMNQTTFGTSGAYSRNSALGVAMSAMLKYPMSAYSNLGGFLGRGALHQDSFAMMQLALWFQAGMLQSMIRNEITGKDYDEQSLLINGIINIPPYGIIGIAAGIGDNPTEQVAQDFSSLINIYQLSK